MKSISAILIFFVYSSFSAQSQSSTMYWNNYTSFNPAAAGLFRQQGAIGYRFDNYEKILTANYNVKVNAIHGGIGLNYAMQEQGFSKHNKVDLNYSYQIQIGRSILSAGVSAGFTHVDDRNILNSITGITNLPKKGKETAFTTNAGLVFSNRNLFAGISSTLLNAPRFNEVFSKPFRAYHFNMGYVVRINRNFKLRPQILYSRDENGFQDVDLNMLVYFKNRFWAGSSYRNRDNLSVMAGFDFRQKYRIGYSVDFTQSMLNNSNQAATHEFTLGFYLQNRSCKPTFNNYTY